MATEILVDIQSTTEVRTHFVSFANDLPSGVTVSGAAAVHTPPSGSAATPTVGTITAGIVPVTIGPLSITGRHILTITATLSNGDLSVARLIIPVEWETARAGLVAIIRKLRGMGNVGSSDYTVGGESYWSDKQLQDVLDSYRQDHYRAALTPTETYNAGVVEYKNYYTGVEWIEQGDTFKIEDAAGNAIGAAQYAMDYQRGHAVFAVSTGGSTLYWSGRSYDLYRAAAEVWRQKAAHHAEGFDFQTDNHRVSRAAVYKQCLAMADYYDQRATTGGVIDLYRSDTC